MTVLRKGPTMPLTLEMYQYEDQLAAVNEVTEGTAVSATFSGLYMDKSSNFVEDPSTNVFNTLLHNVKGTSIDGADISIFYTKGKVQKVAGDKIVISVKGLETYEDFELMNSELNKVFAIKSKDFNFFDRSYIDYNVQLFQTTDSLLKELKGSTRFLIKSFDKNLSKLELEYLN